MAVTKSFAGQSFNLPVNREPKSSDWGTQLSNFCLAVADYAIPKTGGSYELSAELSFGAAYGIKLPYVKTATTNPAASGVVRLANAESIAWRNATNTADLALTVTSGNVLQFNGTGLQPLDADLTALAAMNSTGLLTRIGTASYTLRDIAVGSNKLSISNADGVVGNPTLDVNQANLSLGSIGGSLNVASQVTGTLSTANGGTGQTSASAAINALVPNQTSNSGKVLGTNGSAVSWVASAAVPSAGVVYSDGSALQALSYGSANQLLGMNSAATANEYKTLALGTTAQSNNLGIVNAANALTIHVPDASGTVRGVVTTAAQTFGGTKTFSSGINLGNTNLANYLESTFTPVVTGSGGGVPSGVTVTGTYTRIGNRVLFTAYVLFNKNSLTGNISITGLPISSASAYTAVAMNTFVGLTAPSATYTGPQAYINGTSIVMTWRHATGGAQTAVAVGDFQSLNNELVFSGSYQV